MSRPTGELLVADYNGTARSGKDTIVDRLVERRGRTAKEETGGDYRAIALSLLLDHQIATDMPRQAIAERVADLDSGRIAEVVSRRHRLVGQWGGPDVLYSDAVAATVSAVSPQPSVRRAVKDGLKQRVARVVENEDVDVLLVAGRNLAPVVSDVPGTRLIMRTFVTCSPTEAAIRELTRNGRPSIAVGPEFEAARQMIVQRNEDDRTRKLDRVVPDSDAIDYKDNGDVVAHSLRWIGKNLLRGSGGSYEAVNALTYTRLAPTTEWELMHHGAGTYAAMTGRQLLYDTTFRHYPTDPRDMMVDIASLMLNEAVEVHTLAAQSEAVANELFNGTNWWSDRYFNVVNGNAA